MLGWDAAVRTDDELPITKPIDPLVGKAIEAWEAVRPDQPRMLDRKTGERADFLFRLPRPPRRQELHQRHDHPVAVSQGWRPNRRRSRQYLGRAVAALRDSGQTVDDELLAHISPAMTEPVRLHGTYSFDVDRELAELDPAGYRPLRAVAPNEETT